MIYELLPQSTQSGKLNRRGLGGGGGGGMLIRNLREKESSSKRDVKNELCVL